MALKDTWQDLEDAVAGVENSGSEISIEPINAIAHAVIDNEKNKVDKVEGKGLSTNDFTDEEKNKINANAKKIDYLEKYGESEVIVLTNDEVIIEGNRIVGTRSGKVLNYRGKTVAVPEGIVEIADDSEAFLETADYMISCDKFICSSTMQNIGESTVLANDIILSDFMQKIVLDSNATDYSYSGNITLTNSSTQINGYISRGNIIAPAHINKINLTFFLFDGNLYVYNPKATINCDLKQGGEESTNTTIYGYAGSTAEAFAKENGHTFVNMGSDYSIHINDSTATVAAIKPNEYYTFTGDEEVPLSSLTVTLDIASTTKLDEFMFSFETPSDISSFSFGVLTDESVEIKWIKEPNLKSDYIYEVSVVNGVGVIAGTAKEVA